MLRLMSDDYTAAEYIEHLACLLGYYEPFEAELARAGADVELTRSARLAQDLAMLGISVARIQALPRCPTFVPIPPTGLFGALYVYEGAALGGQIIARRLRSTLGALPGFAFYADDADATRRRWAALCARLSLADAASQDAICATALDLFDTFQSWLERAPGADSGAGE